MTLACVIAAALIVIAGLFAACSDLIDDKRDLLLTNGRIERENRGLAADLAGSNARLAEVLDEHALCPAPVETRLQLVSPQRDEYEWPRIARVLEIESGEPS